MAAVEPTTLSGLPAAELHQKLRGLREELTLLRVKAKRGSVEQPHRIRQTRHQIARILTILNAPARHGGTVPNA